MTSAQAERAGDEALRPLALVDPLLQAARQSQAAGDTPAAHYDEAWDALGEAGAAAYQPAEAVADYLRRRWEALLLEGEDERASSGRPSLLTPVLLEKIAEVAASGAKDTQIYGKLGIKQRTWSHWAEDEEGELARTLRRVRAELAERTLLEVAKMPKGWQAGVWLLTQLFPQDFTRPAVPIEVNATANANATASAAAVVVPAERLKILQDRMRRQLENRVQRESERRVAAGLPPKPTAQERNQ